MLKHSEQYIYIRSEYNIDFYKKGRRSDHTLWKCVLRPLVTRQRSGLKTNQRRIHDPRDAPDIDQ